MAAWLALPLLQIGSSNTQLLQGNRSETSRLCPGEQTSIHRQVDLIATLILGAVQGPVGIGKQCFHRGVLGTALAESEADGERE